MRKINIIFILCLLVMACKNEQNQATSLEESRDKSYSQNDGLITMKGEFVYYADAAVLQTKNDIYGVVIDKNMHTLAEQVKPFKTEDTDMVPVTVRVRKFEKPKDEEGWPYRVEIKDILKVEAPSKNRDDVIKLAN
ncbi:hypothetical protein [Winogradskyella aurantia]|uniref:NlpE C-terminal OB domain-containing protein n=1 Tax=Winogradskyella aurantia TaxID=1915063 RepID=A0A265V0E1_9FLAO|nr:hypothetical protein [Winogradskyella aurantia]OZV70952.1 hypothetical protein CA834_02225 [Winogradskyella aurantia]